MKNPMKFWSGETFSVTPPPPGWLKTVFSVFSCPRLISAAHPFFISIVILYKMWQMNHRDCNKKSTVTVSICKKGWLFPFTVNFFVTVSVVHLSHFVQCVTILIKKGWATEISRGGNWNQKIDFNPPRGRMKTLHRGTGCQVFTSLKVFKLEAFARKECSSWRGISEKDIWTLLFDAFSITINVVSKTVS